MDDSAQRHQYAASVLDAKAEGETLIAPQLMFQEAAHKLLKKGRNGKWGEAKIAEYGETIDFFGVRLLDVTSTVAAHVRFGARWNVPGFDAVFLALAMSTGAKIATLDGGLRTAAKAAGAGLFE